MRTPRPGELKHTLPLAAVTAVTAIALVAAGGRGASDVRAGPDVTWQGLVGSARTRVTTGQRQIVVLKSPSLADRVTAAGGRASEPDERRWTAEAITSQRLLISRLAVQGVLIRRDLSFSRVLNGFSAALDARAVALLERAPEVEGVYPVRTAYPATLSSKLLGGSLFPGNLHGAQDVLPGFDGRGVTIALLDTGVDRSHAYLRGRLAPGVDLVGGDPLAEAALKPDGTNEPERHGTEMAGILVGKGGPDGLHGVATGATVFPIRVAGWQQDAAGGWGLYARTDQLVAGLDRAVDPNEDGDAHDGARIALVPLAEPFGAFSDSPSARAVAGAARLETLVVAPGGNDGTAGPTFGSISGPGGAPAAVSVGAADLRRRTDVVRVALRVGLNVVFTRLVPLGGAVAPMHPVDLVVAAPQRRIASARGFEPPAAAALQPFFDAKGFSLVAGRAALVQAAEDPGTAVVSAARAGATAILLYGDNLPAGALGLDQSVTVPVVGIPAGVARRILAAIATGQSVGVSIGTAHSQVNRAVRHVAAFSSSGLAYDGRVKPDLVAPGVGVATSDPGGAYGTVNGTSAAAAAVAGAAAVVAEARPGLDASALRSVLVESAKPIRADPIRAQGAGLLDAGGAASAEVAVEPDGLALGNAVKAGWKRRERLVIRNVSTRPVRLRINVEQPVPGAAGVVFRVRPRTLTLLRGQGAHVRIDARVTTPPLGNTPAEGAVAVHVSGGGLLRVPWAITFGSMRQNLLGVPRLLVPACAPKKRCARNTFSPSDTVPARLTLSAGRLISTTGGEEVRPLDLLDIELWTADGKDMGLLARVRDVLPGTYAFGLTGRDPLGNVLPTGDYELRFLGVASGGGRVSRRAVAFTIR